MNVVERKHQNAQSDHSEEPFQTDGEESRDIVLGEVLLLVDHLNRDYNLGHDDEKVSGYDSVLVVLRVVVVIDVGESDNDESKHDEQHSKPLERLDLRVEHSNRKQSSENNDGSTEHLEAGRSGEV